MIELKIIYRMLAVDLSGFNKFKANMGHGYTSFAITTKISFIKLTITDVLSYKVVRFFCPKVYKNYITY